MNKRRTLSRRATQVMFPDWWFIDHSRFHLQSACLLAACPSLKHRYPSSSYPSLTLMFVILLYILTVEPTGYTMLEVAGCWQLRKRVHVQAGLLGQQEAGTSRYVCVNGSLGTMKTRTVISTCTTPIAGRTFLNPAKGFWRTIHMSFRSDVPGLEICKWILA